MIADNLQRVRATLPPSVTLVAVSKFHPAEAVLEAYHAGQRLFAESREAECVAKAQSLPRDIVWHFIGHLQRNKVKQIVPWVSLVQSVDTEALLVELEKQTARCYPQRIERFGEDHAPLDVLLQLHIAQEDTKTGFTPDEALDLANRLDLATRFPHLRFRGLMGMASFVDDADIWRREFRTLTATYRQLRAGVFATLPHFDILSFGMSSDYPVAIEEGATMVRIGTAIFGPRQY